MESLVLPVLLVLCAWPLGARGESPVSFPTLEETDAVVFAQVNDTLCRTELGLGKGCEETFLFTRSDNISFNTLTLSENGTVLPNKQAPNVEISGGVFVERNDSRVGGGQSFSRGTSFTLSNLPENRPTTLKVTNQGETGTIRIWSSQEPPTLRINNLTTLSGTPDEIGHSELRFEVKFSGPIIASRPTECALSARDTSSPIQISLTKSALRLNTMEECRIDLLGEASALSSIVVVDGGQALTTRAFPLVATKDGMYVSIITVEVAIPKRTADIVVGIPKGAFMSIPGVNSTHEFMRIFKYTTSKSPGSQWCMKSVALPITYLTGVGVALAVVASIGSSVTSSIYCSGVVWDGCGNGIQRSVNLLGVAQKIFLFGQIAIFQQSQPFKRLSRGFQWTVLDFRPPWDVGLDVDEVLEIEKSFELRNRLQKLKAAVFGLRSGSCAAFSALRFPAIELYFAYWAIAAVTNATIHLLKGSPGEHSHCGHLVQVSGRAVNLIALLLTTVIIAGDIYGHEIRQLLILMGLSVFHLIILRIYRPHNSRWTFGIALLDVGTDVVAFAIGAWLHSTAPPEKGVPLSSTPAHILLGLKLAAFLSFYLDVAFGIVTDVKGMVRTLLRSSSKEAVVLGVILAAQVLNPQYLQRKYSNRWIRKVLGRNVYFGALRSGSAPMEEAIWGWVLGERQGLPRSPVIRAERHVDDTANETEAHPNSPSNQEVRSLSTSEEPKIVVLGFSECSVDFCCE
ncbi:hypothetical protein BSKO_08600 [Bryopsis sp. KO-2023]|nr:hypothetical protein BSKO_08600 [Bryopsis sp. KO-2023]